MDAQAIGLALSTAAAMFVTPVVMRLWRRRSPPSPASDFDTYPPDELKRRNNWVYLIAYCLSFVGICSPLLLYAHGLSQHNPWPVGLGFGLAVILPFTFASLVTLPRGVSRFREFWRFFEIQNGIRLRVMCILFVPLGVLGLVSVYKLAF